MRLRSCLHFLCLLSPHTVRRNHGGSATRWELSPEPSPLPGAGQALGLCPSLPPPQGGGLQEAPTPLGAPGCPPQTKGAAAGDLCSAKLSASSMVTPIPSELPLVTPRPTATHASVLQVACARRKAWLRSVRQGAIVPAGLWGCPDPSVHSPLLLPGTKPPNCPAGAWSPRSLENS